MPTGVHNNHTRNGGRKPECLCGTCRVCKVREWARAFRLRQKNRTPRPKNQPTISDRLLDQRIDKYFKQRGWDQ